MANVNAWARSGEPVYRVRSAYFWSIFEPIPFSFRDELKFGSQTRASLLSLLNKRSLLAAVLPVQVRAGSLSWTSPTLKRCIRTIHLENAF